MTSADTIPMIPPTGVDYEGIRTIQRYCHEQARTRGFHDVPDEMKRHIRELRAQGREKLAEYIGLVYIGNCLMLGAGEFTEAHEELRSGHPVNESYYATGSGDDGTLKKPEGVPSELADVVIRVFDLAEELGIDLGAVIEEKLKYNATRIAGHGRKF